MRRINENTISISFERNGNEWFAIIHEWEGDRSDLQMVAGADDMCEILSQGESVVHVVIVKNVEPEKYRVRLDKMQDTPEIGGATYMARWSNEFQMSEFDIWLCDVTLYVFGCLPETLYIK